jgi:uncharacterized membrane protein
MQDIGTLGGPESAAYAVNKDGSVIAGTLLTSGSTGSNHSLVWTRTNGMQDLKTILDAAGVHTSDNWFPWTLSSEGAERLTKNRSTGVGFACGI